jgi:predicted ArsR family transcriptional regulator
MKHVPPPGLDPHLARAIVHPTRRAILKLLKGEKGVRPRAIAEKLGVGTANARYHVDVLLACGAVEAVPDEQRGGEPLVRLYSASRRKKRRSLDPTGAMRDDVTDAQLRNLIEIAGDLGIGYDGRGA